ncbi:hypothetical protein Tco_0243440 [Tanacetum coccineum]
MANNETECSPSEVCLSNSDNEFLIPISWSNESKNEKGQKDKCTEVMKDKVSQEHVCEEEVPLNNDIGKQSGDLVEMPSEAVEQGWMIMYLMRLMVANRGGDELVDKGRPLKKKKVYVE